MHVPYDTDDPAAIIDALDADPERVARIRRRNAVNALRRHDWVYRWERVLELLGLDQTQRLRERRATLHRLAEELEARGDRDEPERWPEQREVRRAA